MSRKLGKSQKNQKRAKEEQKKIKKYEAQDALGISRKKYSFKITEKRYVITKLVLLALIPISYFLFSTWLVVIFILYALTFFLAIGYEHTLNKSVIKRNQIKLPKYDNALAFLLIMIALFGSLFGQTGRIGQFANTYYMKFIGFIRNFGSLLTGRRDILSDVFGFGLHPRPDGFISNSDQFHDMVGSMPPPEHFGNRRPPMNFDLSNVPIEFMFSQILSTVSTVLIFTVFILGIASIYYTYRKIKKFNTVMQDATLDGKITLLEDEAIEALFQFGEIETK